MTHYLGRVVVDGRTVSDTTGIDLVPAPGPLGGPRFVVLYFDNVELSAGARLEVQLGYDTDVFDLNSGPSFWTRPANPNLGPIQIRIRGGTGTARLQRYGSGEPSDTPGHTPGTPTGSRSNPDPFLHTDPYVEPIYETRLECNPGFDWQNAACPLTGIAPSVQDRVRNASGIVFHVHDGHVSSCSGTLVAGDLFLTSRHCFTDATGADVASASVTFDYYPNCDGSRPAGHNAKFFKVLEEVAAGVPAGTGYTASNDWVLLRLDGAPGALPPSLEMRPAVSVSGETVFTMHHPGGSVKKTQVGTAGTSYSTGAVQASNFDFAGGSSGSSLFDTEGRLVGGPLSSGSGCSVTFASISQVVDTLENPPVPATPLDVMLVFDKSGSMGSTAPPIGRTKLEEAQDAAALFVQLVREGQGDRLGLVTFNHSAAVETPPGDVASVKPVLVGPSPYVSGQVSAITSGGATSIGAGVQAALTSFGVSTNDRAMLLLSDGMQNTAPTLESVEGMLGDTKLCVIGFGSDAQLNGPLLTRVAREHDGQYTRATDGLALRKFFGLCFGNIFETGALADPDFVLGRGVEEAVHEFDVCGEERFTLVLGWDDSSTPLRACVRTPSGVPIDGKKVRDVRGRTWAFWRVDLPHLGERDGTWKFTVSRLPGDVEFPPPPTEVKYFFLVVCNGGPRLTPLRPVQSAYTGDPITPLVGLHYPNSTVPQDAKVMLEITAPEVSLGELVTKHGLVAANVSADAVSAFHATLQAVAGSSGELPVPTTTIQVPLFDDGFHEDGAMEPDGVFGDVLQEITKHEGSYDFRAIATFGRECRARREVFWSMHVELGIDPDATEVTIRDAVATDSGVHGQLVIVPRDRYRNPLGPGRPGGFTLHPIPGVVVLSPPQDRGDGSYVVDIDWDPERADTPGVIIRQPDRDPVVVTVPPRDPPCPGKQPDCRTPARRLLDCLGIPGKDVERITVESVRVRFDLNADPCAPLEEDCRSKKKE